ncbi:hypothetical protein [Brasilonema sp. UFV-L1]|uniref:hypothetical protein n=1 Tax=Brasilonema sp. UFV-L1 TaxID=2234130 RepID=UPI00145DD529|nr:hypothetical protein [Brasilonema sp. UFV-L1]NMG11167.1 hypothetical protein [Brasilonema sp. UFV-L1]
MLKRLIRWLKKFLQRLFGSNQVPAKTGGNVHKEPPPPLSDTDLEFLFTELLEGAYQARGQAWACKWLNNIEHRVSKERWVEWLQRFGARLLASPTPNNELASRMVQLGELDIGEVGDVAYEIGMQLLTRAGGEPIWEYDGPDAVKQTPAPRQTQSEQHKVMEQENLPEGEYETVTLDQLFVLLQQDENLRNQVAQQLGLQTDDPEIIIQALLEQYQAASESNANPAES